MPDRTHRPHRPGASPPRRSRPSARPVARPPANRTGPPAGSGATTRISAPRPRRRVTGRAVVLAVVLVALALSYVFPLRVYLAQQAEIGQLRTDQREQRARIAELAAQAELWSTDEYIRIQARKRLYFGEPGEMLLLPVWEDDQPAPDPGDDPDRQPVSPEPWWDSLWTSIRSADSGPSG